MIKWKDPKKTLRFSSIRNRASDFAHPKLREIVAPWRRRVRRHSQSLPSRFHQSMAKFGVFCLYPISTPWHDEKTHHSRYHHNTLNLGKFHHDLTVLFTGNHGFLKGNHPQMAARFRLVKYYNLPRLNTLTTTIERMIRSASADDVAVSVIDVPNHLVFS
jgi:hypothetical protein